MAGAAEEGAMVEEKEALEKGSWGWPNMHFAEMPDCLSLFSASQESNIKRRVGKQRADLVRELKSQGNFFKGVKWSPDGACFASLSEDTGLRIFDLPGSILEQPAIPDITTAGLPDSYSPAVLIWGGETVYDFCWYPHMLATDQASCCLVSTARGHPVHLWDAVTGELRCTYRAYDAVDEITAAISVAFNPSGNKIFCGYRRVLRVFDVTRPGRNYTQHPTLVREAHGRPQGQAGIISCLAFDPEAPSPILAAGSYDRTTGLYSEATGELLFVLHGQQGGVTQVQFSRDGNYLYTGARKDPEILCWDIRNTAGVLYRLPRDAASTNQRIGFDIEPCGRHLASGGQDGCVRVYDLQTGTWVAGFQSSEDTVNGCSFHPCLPLLATCSGQRRFDIFSRENLDRASPSSPSSSSSSSSHEDDATDNNKDPSANTSNIGLVSRMAIWRFPWSYDSDEMVSASAEHDTSLAPDPGIDRIPHQDPISENPPHPDPTERPTGALEVVPDLGSKVIVAVPEEMVG